MTVDQQQRYSSYLGDLAESLDIPPSRYEDAVVRYTAVGTWLSTENSPLAPYDPDIYTQGSFALGTVVRPIGDEDHYDIDLVCQLNIDKATTTQKWVKSAVGDRLKVHADYARMLDKEGKRCWTLNYANGTRFHMDILPAIPDAYDWLIALGVPRAFAQFAICITDKESWDTDIDWPKGNPKGYAAWFRGQMRPIFDARRKSMAEQIKASIDDVPEYKVKTPLQRAIQILKRHRDIYFENNGDNKPTSIIITTLAALAYGNQADLYDALVAIISGMPSFLQKDAVGNWQLPNPVNPGENFCERWKNHPARPLYFMAWLQKVQSDIDDILSGLTIDEVALKARPAFGTRAVNEALTQHKNRTARATVTSRLSLATAIIEKSNPTPRHWSI